MQFKSRRRFQLESLESRCLLAADVFITEFMAINNGALLDEDRDDADWIELYNAGPDDADLSQYFLTDSANNLGKWQLPDTTLPSGNHLVVFASNKDRRDADGQPHTDFKLSGGGEYLALSQQDPEDPANLVVLSEFAPQFPQQFGNVSYGSGQNVDIESLTDKDASSKLFFPTDNSLGDAWIQADFDDASWTDGTLAVGYQRTEFGFLVEDAKAEGRIENLAEAVAVLNGEGQTSRTVTISPTINFHDVEGGGGDADMAPNDAPFPNNTPADDDDFTVRATGTITIPTTDTWGFGAVSDDGSYIKINGEFVYQDDTQHTAELNFGVVDLPAGEHQIEVVYFERGGPAELEVFAGTEGPALIGDTARGGIAVRTGSTVTGLSDQFQTQSLEPMFERTTSAFVRNTFTADTNSLPDNLTLRMQYDGGFVAYLNGTEIARRNVDESLQFDSVAAAERADQLITSTESIDISQHISLLHDGENVLALHGVNDAINSDDFLLTASLAEIKVSATTDFYFPDSTPGAFNPASGVQGFLTHEISFSQPHGFYDELFTVEIAAATPNATIRYTTDGSAPTRENGTDYSQPIAIDHTTTLQARAFLDTFEPSFTETASFVFLADVVNQSSNGRAPETFPTLRTINGQVLNYGMDPDIVQDEQWGPQLVDALTQVPSMSIVMDVDDLVGEENGIYTNANSHGRDWERPASLELINPDGTVGFQINAGVRIRGGFSRTSSNPKHAFRLFFRDDYGDGQLEFPLFGDSAAQEFQKIDLRTTQNYAWAFQGDARNTFLRDAFARDAQGEMGQAYTRSEYYHLYLNGQYWGLFQTQERAEANYAASYFGGSADDYDVVKSAGSSGNYTNEATDGDLNAYSRLADYFYQENGLADDNMDAYWQAQGMNTDGTSNPDFERLLDVDNLIDYATLLYYTGDRDGPVSRFVPERVNNYYAVYNRESPDGFQFFEHDSEHSLDTGDTTLVTPVTSSGRDFEFFNPQWMHEQLVASNSEYRLKFADRVYEHFFDDGLLTTESSQARLDSRAAQIDLAIIAESARWGDAQRSDPLDKQDWLEAVAATRGWFDGRSELVVNQFRAQGWLETANPPRFMVDGLATRHANVHVDSEILLESDLLVNQTELISAEETWSYLDDGSNVDAAWNIGDFDDSEWPAGLAELGYGDNDEQTVIGVREDGELRPVTVYFRKQFTLSEEFDRYTVRLKRDDGAAVYVNGTEVVRDNLPEGELDFETEAVRGTRRTDESAFFDFVVDASLFQPGTNTIAVEVHQTSATATGDLSFDLQLLGGNEDLSIGSMLYTLDGSDPRLPGGSPNPAAFAYDGAPLSVDQDVTLNARVRVNDVWSALGSLDLVSVPGRRGDVTSDGLVDANDIDAITAAIQAMDHDVKFDLNHDAVVDELDVDYLVEGVLKTRRGDSNMDGKVDFADFLALSLHFGDTDTTWADGNFGTDGSAGFDDFLELAANFGFDGSGQD